MGHGQFVVVQDLIDYGRALGHRPGDPHAAGVDRPRTDMQFFLVDRNRNGALNRGGFLVASHAIDLWENNHSLLRD
jgi:hypothetical protein